MAQGRFGAVDLTLRMSVINAPRPLATGIDTAVQALKKAQDRLGVAAVDVARQGAAMSEPSSTKEGPRTRLPAQTPPNPGPPGGANPADLAQAMVARSSRPPADFIQATLNQKTSTKEVAANVKTVQAFDAMLDEVSRLQQADRAEKSE